MRYAALVLLSLLGAARAPAAVPLDVLDPTPREIRLELEVSPAPYTVGQSFMAPLPATYAVSGSSGTVTLAGSDYEAYLESFGAPEGAVIFPGTFSDYVIQIDLGTLEASAHASGQLMPPLGGLSTWVSTTTSGGFIGSPDVQGPLFCDPASIPGCTAVPGAPYDPQTGKLNAVGWDRVSFQMTIDMFSFAGDLRLTETAPPAPVPVLSPSALILLAVLLVASGGSLAPARAARPRR